MEVFKEYMEPKIIKELDINFNENQLLKQITNKLKQNIKFLINMVQEFII